MVITTLALSTWTKSELKYAEDRLTLCVENFLNANSLICPNLASSSKIHASVTCISGYIHKNISLSNDFKKNGLRLSTSLHTFLVTKLT